MAASFASLVVIMTVFHSAGALIAPVVSEWIFDQTQSYPLVLVIVSPLLLVSGVAFADPWDRVIDLLSRYIGEFWVVPQNQPLEIRQP